MTFDHDWWYRGGYDRQLTLAKECCTAIRFPEEARDPNPPGSAAAKYAAELETRSVVYLRDGFSYELKRIVNTPTTSYLAFECVASEPAYKVGAFVVSVPFEEICRVETFAVHPNERPDEGPTIKGFAGSRMPSAARGDGSMRQEVHDREEIAEEEEA